MFSIQQERTVKGDNTVRRVYAEKRALTHDVGGSATTTEFTDAVIAALEDPN